MQITKHGYIFGDRDFHSGRSLHVTPSALCNGHIILNSIRLSRTDQEEIMSILQRFLDTGSLHPPEDKTQALEEENAALRKRLEAVSEALKEGGDK